jgi:hypothetical protein
MREQDNNNSSSVSPKYSTKAEYNTDSISSIEDRLADPRPTDSSTTVYNTPQIVDSAEYHLNIERKIIEANSQMVFDIQNEAANHMNPNEADKTRALLSTGIREAEELKREAIRNGYFEKSIQDPEIARDALEAQSEYCDKLTETVYNADAMIQKTDPDPIQSSGNTVPYNVHMSSLLGAISKRETYLPDREAEIKRAEYNEPFHGFVQGEVSDSEADNSIGRDENRADSEIPLQEPETITISDSEVPEAISISDSEVPEAEPLSENEEPEPEPEPEAEAEPEAEPLSENEEAEAEPESSKRPRLDSEEAEVEAESSKRPRLEDEVEAESSDRNNNNQATGSLVEDYADTSLEMPGYMDGDD